jgi:hypothetical protein
LLNSARKSSPSAAAAFRRVRNWFQITRFRESGHAREVAARREAL